MSFHSTHATSQALQPMQVVVSISLATVNCRCVSSPGTLPAWPEIFCTRNVAWLIVSSDPFDFNQEAFEFRRVGVGINHCWRKIVGQISGGLSFIFRNSAIPPVNRNADLIRFLSIDHH